MRGEPCIACCGGGEPLNRRIEVVGDHVARVRLVETQQAGYIQLCQQVDFQRTNSLQEPFPTTIQKAV